TPFESGLAWTVSADDVRDFIGKTACLEEPQFKLIGLELVDKGVLRGHQKILLDDTEIGEITSGTFSPTLEKSIALARVKFKSRLSLDQPVQIAIRKKLLAAKVVRYPFFKSGKTS
ncbi:MAG: hypothetical protein KTR16_15215, partial [Acidiferrobacterales bacterium]|nr:hypothetical protein [Acidiferrobacterales bacterium]